MGGFHGQTPSPAFERALRLGERGGAIVFSRNLEGTLEQASELTGRVRALSLHAPIVCVDQEGGRVARLRTGVVQLPSMRAVAGTLSASEFERVAYAQALDLACLGFSTHFAPVLDVDSEPDNPIIGDRSFSSEPEIVAAYGLAAIRGAERGGLFACAKHFPGHGDTTLDSHLALPTVHADRSTLDARELLPFRVCIDAGLGALMSAHVVYPALDPGVAATLSGPIMRTLLRDTLGFGGVVFSDDLEMKAISGEMGVGEAAVGAVEAGCDVLLICSDEGLQDNALAELVRHAERDASFRQRVTTAAARIDALMHLTEERRPPTDAASVGRGAPAREARTLLARVHTPGSPT